MPNSPFRRPAPNSRRFALHSDGAFSDALRLEFGQSIHMDGRTVILQASRKVPAAIREVLDRAGRSPSSIATFLMHQANQILIVKIAQTLEVAHEKFYSNIARYGNTSSAYMLIAAADWSDAGAFQANQATVFACIWRRISLGRVAGGPVPRNMTSLSVVIPAYNEEARLGPTLDAAVGFIRAKHFAFTELIVVDDGSRDGTAALVERFARDHSEVRLLRNPGNRGKGYSVRHGDARRQGRLGVVYRRGSFGANRRVRQAGRRRGKGHCASRHRIARARPVPGRRPSIGLSGEVSGRAFNVIMRGITGLPFRDTAQCGFKLFERSAAAEIFHARHWTDSKLRRGGSGYREIAGSQGDRGSGGLEQRGGNQSRAGMLTGVQSFADLAGIRWRCKSKWPVLKAVSDQLRDTPPRIAIEPKKIKATEV